VGRNIKFFKVRSKPSEMLEAETREMEKRLEELQKIMKLEKE
jgi:hypothetical protein